MTAHDPLYAILVAGMIGTASVALLIVAVIVLAWIERRFPGPLVCDGANCPNGVCICGAFE